MIDLRLLLELINCLYYGIYLMLVSCSYLKAILKLLQQFLNNQYIDFMSLCIARIQIK